MASTNAWVAVDWGTSNLRAWAVDAAGNSIGATSSEKGMGKLTRPEYPAVLGKVLSDLDQSGDVEVMICGMAGARQGWIEAPYLEAPTDLRDLAKGAVHPDAGDVAASVSILPGVCQRQGGEDVMRGEETQLLGLAATHEGYSGLVCMPGTHSKWALLDGTNIRRFNTAMTGEMFEILKTHSVLRHSLGGELDGQNRAEGFAAGAADGLEKPQALLGQLFGVRASALLSDRGPDWCAGYLSGLLIGTEIAAQRPEIGNEAVPLIGSTGLCKLYAQVLEMAGCRGELVDAASVVLAGLTAARNAIN